MQGIQEWAFHGRKEETAQNEDGGCAAGSSLGYPESQLASGGCLKKAKMLDDVLDGVEITIQTVRLTYF